MANKKISELQLISSVTDSIMLPIDNGIQSYRSTAAQWLAYILGAGKVSLSALNTSIFHGLTAVTAADDDYFPLVDTSDSNLTKKALVSTFVRNLYRSVSSFPATVADTDGTMKLSGASGTITLPTAVGRDGRRFKFVHAGTSLSQLYTLATTSSQTVGGIAGGSYKLCTAGEVLEIESDGANWIILNHVTGCYGTFTDQPTAFGTATNLAHTWTRQGNKMHLEWRWTNGTTTGSEGRAPLPSGATSAADYPTLQCIGGGWMAANSGAGYGNHANVLAEASKAYVTFSTHTTGTLSKCNGNVSTTGAVVSFTATVRITDFQP